MARLGVHPNLITVAGLALVGVAAIFIARGMFLTAGAILLVSLPLDALDGAVARAMNRSSPFGMMLDSTVDRYADGFIFAALGYYFAVQSQHELLILALLALVGSFLVSYVRARADDAKVAVSVKVGWFTRLERVAVIVVMLLGAGLLQDAGVLALGIVILAVGTNLTALQRLLFVYAALKNRGD